MALHNRNSATPQKISSLNPDSTEGQDIVSLSSNSLDPKTAPKPPRPGSSATVGGQGRLRAGQMMKHASGYLLAVVVLTMAHGVRYFREPSLSPRDLAPNEFIAPTSEEFINPVATARERERIIASAQTLLTFDESANAAMDELLMIAFVEGDRLRQEAELVPYLSTAQLSVETQRYLQQLLPEEWERWQRMVGSSDLGQSQRDGEETILDAGSATGSWIPLDAREQDLDYSVIFNLGPISSGADGTVDLPTEEGVTPGGELVIPEVQLTALRELLQLRRTLPSVANVSASEGESEFAALSASESSGLSDLVQSGLMIPEQFSAISYQQALNVITVAQHRYQLVRSQLQGGTYWQEDILLWDQSQWFLFRREVAQALERMQAIGISEGLPERGLQRGITAQLEDVPEEMHGGAIALLSNVLVSNLRENQQLMQERLDIVLEGLEPVMVSYEAGQVILQRGEPITEEIFAVLDHYNLTDRRLNVSGLLGLGRVMAGVVLVVTPVYLLVRPKLNSRYRLRSRDRLLLLLLMSTVAPIASLAGVQYSSLPIVGLLGGSYFGGWWGLLVLAGASLLLPLATPVSGVALWSGLLPGLVSGVLACGVASRMRSREEMAMLGGGMSLAQGLTYAAVTLALGQPFSWAALAVAGGMGLLWGVTALGASPHLESMFDVVTPIRLAELANPNRPLLRRLANEAPGTFQHTLFVASLAERAAQKLGLNVELVRTGTLYHDIGKMVEAEYFIENQMGKPNPHDQLEDPYRSAEIILAHVPDGLRLARQYRLPSAIQAFIPEHQGTIKVAYFYHEAQKQAGSGNPPDEALFRYQGPIPQCRETGVVMLADACEAALRSLRSPAEGGEPVSPEVAKRTIMSIFRNRWEDKQLVDSGLDRADLEVIAEVFLQVWRESSHERIRYPKAISATP